MVQETSAPSEGEPPKEGLPTLSAADSLGPTVPVGAGGEPGGGAGASDQPAEAMPQIDGYQITAKISDRGGQGTVWRAIQLSTGQEVALKFLRAGAFGSDQAKRRFEREVELAAALKHPHIARIYDSGLRQGVYYYAMEYVDGLHLDEFVLENKLSQKQILELVRTVAQAVQHAHQRGVIHRDLKPSNTLIDKDGEPHIVDFGLAKTLDPGEGATVSLDGDIAGTPAYMAPEQAAGHLADIDTRSDVYSLGVILYWLLVGQSPRDLSGSRLEVLQRLATQEVRRPRQVAKAIDKELEALLLKALAFEPGLRYASAGDLAVDVDNYLTGEPLIAQKPTTMYFLRKRIHKYRLPLSIAAGILAVLIGGGVFSYVRVVQERDRAGAAEQTAVSAKQQAEDTDRASRERLVATYIRNGAQCREDGDESTGLLWLAEALSLIDRASASNKNIKKYATNCRIHIKQTLAKCPEVEAFWPGDGLVSPDGKLIATFAPGKDTSVKILHIRTGKPAIPTLQHHHLIYKVVFSPVGKIMATDTEQGVRLWDLLTGRPIGSLLADPVTAQSFWSIIEDQPVMMCHHIEFHPDGKQVEIMPAGQGRGLFDSHTGNQCGEPISLPPGHGILSVDRSRYMVYTKKGDLIKRGAQPAATSTVQIWDVKTGQPLSAAIPVHEWGDAPPLFDPMGRYVIDDAFGILSLEKQGAKWQKLDSTGEHGPLTCISISPNGTYYLAGKCALDVNRLRRFGPPYVICAARPLRGSNGIDDHELRLAGEVKEAAFSRDSQLLAILTTDMNIRVWHVPSGELLTAPIHSDSLCYFGFTSDGRGIVTRGRRYLDGTAHNIGVTVYSLPMANAGVPPTQPRCADIPERPMGKSLSDGTRTLLYQSRNAIRVHSAKTGKPLSPIMYHREQSVSEHNRALGANDSWNDDVCEAWFSPRGQYVVTVGKGTVMIWDSERGQLVTRAFQHAFDIDEVVMSDDEQRIAVTFGGDRYGNAGLDIYDVLAGTRLASPQYRWEPGCRLEFLKGGLRLANVLRAEGADKSGNFVFDMARWQGTSGSIVLQARLIAGRRIEPVTGAMVWLSPDEFSETLHRLKTGKTEGAER